MYYFFPPGIPDHLHPPDNRGGMHPRLTTGHPSCFRLTFDFIDQSNEQILVSVLMISLRLTCNSFYQRDPQDEFSQEKTLLC